MGYFCNSIFLFSGMFYVYGKPNSFAFASRHVLAVACKDAKPKERAYSVLLCSQWSHDDDRRRHASTISDSSCVGAAEMQHPKTNQPKKADGDFFK